MLGDRRDPACDHAVSAAARTVMPHSRARLLASSSSADLSRPTLIDPVEKLID
jgi:hypothetical protein